MLLFFRIKKAVVLINELDTAKFPLLLTRILSKLHLKVCICIFDTAMSRYLISD